MGIRAELIKSHDRVWQFLARPGAWFTGAQRVALVSEFRFARQCGLCQKQKSSLSPGTVNGDHEFEISWLSPSQVEIIHKLANDPGRITRSWVEARLADGVEDVEYVEIAGIVSAACVVDTFHVALGMSLRPLPDPVAGAPSKERPRTAIDCGAFVPMIPVDGLADDYEDLYDTRHWVPNVHRAFSLVPGVTRIANDLMRTHYFEYELVPRYLDKDHGYAINKMQIELVASRVSIYNDCFY